MGKINIKWSRIKKDDLPSMYSDNNGCWYVKNLYGIENLNVYMVQIGDVWKYIKFCYINPETGFNSSYKVDIANNSNLSISYFKHGCVTYMQTYYKTIIDKILCKDEDEQKSLSISIAAGKLLDDNLKEKLKIEKIIDEYEKDYQDRYIQWKEDIKNGVKIDVTPLAPAYMYCEAGMKYPHTWDGESKIYESPREPIRYINQKYYQDELKKLIEKIEIGSKRLEKLNSSYYDEIIGKVNKNV